MDSKKLPDFDYKLPTPPLGLAAVNFTLLLVIVTMDAETYVALWFTVAALPFSLATFALWHMTTYLVKYLDTHEISATQSDRVASVVNRWTILFNFASLTLIFCGLVAVMVELSYIAAAIFVLLTCIVSSIVQYVETQVKKIFGS